MRNFEKKLLKLTQELNLHIIDENKLFMKLLKEIKSIVNYHEASIKIFHERTRTYKAFHSTKSQPENNAPIDGTLSKLIFVNKKPYTTKNLAGYKYTEELFRYDSKNISLMGIPVMMGDKVVATIELERESKLKFTRAEFNIFRRIGNLVSFTILNSILYEKFNNFGHDSILALVDAIDKRDPYTSGHSERVKNYSLLIGKALNLHKRELINLEYAALLHDVGKIGIADNVLKKGYKLSDEEYEIMKTHPEKGYQILKPVYQFRYIIDSVRQHHERWDGYGYPLGIKGSDIDFKARIITVADAFDAMINTRIYRKPIPYDDTIEEIISNKGKQFDPEIVDVFIKEIDEYHNKIKSVLQYEKDVISFSKETSFF